MSSRYRNPELFMNQAQQNRTQRELLQGSRTLFPFHRQICRLNASLVTVEAKWERFEFADDIDVALFANLLFEPHAPIGCIHKHSARSLALEVGRRAHRRRENSPQVLRI